MSRDPSKIAGPDFQRMVCNLMPVGAKFSFTVEDIARGYVRLRLHFHERQLRPGGTIAGPVMFMLADAALWAAVMSVVGEVPLAVTADMNIRFLKRPTPRDLVAECELIKTTGRLMAGTVTMFSDGDGEPVAHVTGTYAVPRTARAAKGLG